MTDQQLGIEPRRAALGQASLRCPDSLGDRGQADRSISREGTVFETGIAQPLRLVGRPQLVDEEVDVAVHAPTAGC